MRVLVACECSNTVRDAFLARGHDAYSCDLQRAQAPNRNWRRHIVGDVRPLLREEWDLVIAHPPCTYLCNSGVHLLRDNPVRQEAMMWAVEFFVECLRANSPRVAVENPTQHCYAREHIPEPSQGVHPYQFGEPYTKLTYLWLKGLPKLVPTNVVSPVGGFVYGKNDGKDRKNKRSKTVQGIADAMAEQWG